MARTTTSAIEGVETTQDLQPTTETLAARARRKANKQIEAEDRQAGSLFIRTDHFKQSRIARLEEPCVLVDSAEEHISFVVFLDGSVWMLDDQYHADDTEDGTIYIESPDPIADALAHAGSVLVLSEGARGHTGLPKNPSAAAMADWAARHGGKDERVVAAFEDIFANLEDPLIDMNDEGQNWTEEQAEICEKVLSAALQTDPRFDEGHVELFSAGPEGQAHIGELDHPDSDAIIERAWRILENAVDGLGKMSGTAYHYNDGAMGRRSGYYEANPCITCLEVKPVSAHERVRAQTMLRNLLAEKGYAADVISEIMSVP